MSYAQVRNEQNQCVSVTVAVAPGNGYYHQPGGPGGGDNCYGGIRPYGLTCSDPNKTLRVSTVPGESSGDVRWNNRPGYWTVNVRSIAGIDPGQSGIEYIGTCNQFSGDRKSQCENLCGSNPTCVLMGPHDNAWAGKIDYEYHLNTIRLSSSGVSCVNGQTSVTLNWQANYDFTTLRLYRGDVNGRNATEIATLPTQRIGSYRDTIVQPGTTYTYWINAVSPDGQTWSNPPYDRPLAVTTPQPCTAERPPVLDLDMGGYYSQSTPSMVGLKPSGDGLNVVNNVPVILGTSIYRNSGTRAKIIFARADGEAIANCSGQAITINVPAGTGSDFAGEAVPACVIYNDYPTESMSLTWTQPDEVMDYYVWVEARKDGSSVACTGATQFYPDVSDENSVKIGGVDYFWCGDGSRRLMSNLKTQGLRVVERPGVTPINQYGLSGQGAQNYNPIRITPRIAVSSNFDSSAVSLQGVAFIDINTSIDQLRGSSDNLLTRLITATANKRGFAIVYARHDQGYVGSFGRINFERGNYYLIFNGAVELISNSTYSLDKTDIKVEVQPVRVVDLDSLSSSPNYTVEFRDGLGSRRWNMYDFTVMSNNVYSAQFVQRNCDPTTKNCN